MSKKPNFFLIGAPKCGTTSMANWISQHPQIYMSPVKEPFFFNRDLNLYKKMTLHDYEQLFAGVNEQHIAIGEASAMYLYSEEAVGHILKYCESPKFVVMLRNPIEMAYSFHGQLVKNGEEQFVDFEKAWHLQEKRKREGAPILPFVDLKLLMYGEVCKLGKQVERLFQIVDRAQVLVLFLEDIQENPKFEYEKLLDFLGVKSDERESFPVLNTGSQPRLPIVNFLLRSAHFLVEMKYLPKLKLGILSKISKLNSRSRNKQGLSIEMRKQLIAFFDEDITKLGQLLHKDLSKWKVIKE